MNASQPLPWKFIFTTLIRYSPLWCGATLFCGALGFAYSIVKSDMWEASQPLIVREEASGSELKLGRFSSQTDLQAAQETILEMARNREVVTKALTELGPYSTFTGRNWPSSAVVNDVASDWISVRAPETSEFGKTEVIYLSTKAETPKRAELFCQLLFTALSDHLRDVRRLRADSVIVELQHATELAQAALVDASEQLNKLESTVGTDLGELRGLSESLSGDGGSSLIRSELERDIRAAEMEVKKIEALQELLLRSRDDTNHLLISDAELLLTQPTLQKLKVGLIDAQLEASKLAGRVTETHPRMLAAMRSQETIRTELRTEIDNVISAMDPALDLSRRKLQALKDRKEDLSQKLASLAKIRTEYSRLVSEVRNRTQILNDAQASLTEAEALRSAAINTNLLAVLGPPKAGETPVGLGTKQVTVGAMAAGLLLGLGGVFLIAPNPNGHKFGRRQSDTLGGRRAEDHVVDRVSEQRKFVIPNTDRRAVNRLTGERNGSPGGDTDDSTSGQHADTPSQIGNANTDPSEAPTNSALTSDSHTTPFHITRQTESRKVPTAVAEAIAAARPKPKPQPNPTPQSESSESAENSKSEEGSYHKPGSIQIVQPSKAAIDSKQDALRRMRNGNSSRAQRDAAPTPSSPASVVADNAESNLLDGTMLLNDDIVQDLQRAAKKNKPAFPSSEVPRT